MKSDRGKRRGRTWAIWAGVFLAVLLLSRPSQAAIKYWVDATDWWDVSANWSPAGQPQNGDSVYLTQSDATNRTVYYRNTAYPSAVLYVLRINATGSGTMTLIQGYGGYADPLASSYEYVGFSGGTGTHLQRAGSNTISNDLWLGVQTGSTGNYELSGNSSSRPPPKSSAMAATAPLPRRGAAIPSAIIQTSPVQVHSIWVMTPAAAAPTT
jgi:hypothetical protein